MNFRFCAREPSLEGYAPQHVAEGGTPPYPRMHVCNSLRRELCILSCGGAGDQKTTKASADLYPKVACVRV